MLGFSLGIDEDDDPVGSRFLLQQPEQQRKLFPLGNVVKNLLDSYNFV